MAEPAYSRRLDEAIALAVDAFRHIRRKGTDIPYVTHLLSVTAFVGEYGGDEDQLIAAVLHDWLEDVDGADVGELERRFGPRVARLVSALTDATVRPKPPWRERKEAYLRHLRSEPPEVKLISAADKLHNCLCIRRDLATTGPALWSRFAGERAGTLWYYDAVVGALGDGWAHPLHSRLSDEVGALLQEARHG